MSVETRHSTFAQDIRNNGERFYHPRLSRRQREIDFTIPAQLEDKLAEAIEGGLADKFPELLPHEADQPLLLTPYDDYEGLEVAIPPEEYLEGWKTLREANLRLANHPARIHAMMELEKAGFKKPEKRKGVIDEYIERGITPQLSDLGHNRDSVNGKIESKQVHRTDLLEQGPFSFTSKKRVGSFVNMGAMPDTNGSVLMIETAAKMFMRVGVPEVGVFSDPKVQARLAKAVMERLTIDDPLLEGRSDEEKKFIVDHWRACVVGVLEVHPRKALERAFLLKDAGLTSFRPYGHSVGRDIIGTTKLLRKELDDEDEFFPSQITNEDIALECEQVGADAIVEGVGGGARCTTPERSQMIPANAELAWKLRGRLGIPIIGEGGAVDDIVISILVGMSGVNGSGSIGGGVFEAPGGMFFFTRDGEKFLKPYGGEASPRTKFISKRLYLTGLPYFSEGEQTFNELLTYEESMTQKTLNHWERIALGATMLGVDEGPYTISAMQNLDPSPLLEKSPTTEFIQGTH